MNAALTPRPTPPAPFPAGRGPRNTPGLRRAIAGVAALLLCAGAVLAAPDAPPVAPAPREAKPKFVAPKLNDTFEVLVFASQRPVRVRVTCLQDGKSINDGWRERLKRAFDYFDRDGDGYLGPKEVTSMFSDAGLGQLLQNGLYQPGPNYPQVLAPGRDRLSFEEFVAYYSGAAAQVFRALPVQPDNFQNATVTEALFALMDANGDGKLTKAEVDAVEKLTATRDADEDECLSMQELVPNAFGRNLGGRGFQPVQPPNGVYPTPAAAQAAVIYAAGRIPGTVTQQVIKKYDQDGDFELTRAECGFDEATFLRLDADKNGRLDGEELDVWRTGAPDLEITLDLGAKSDASAATLVDEAGAAARGFKIRRGEAGKLALHVGRQPVEFWAFAPVAAVAQPPLKQQYGYLFTQAAGQKAFIEDKDLKGPNAVQFQFVRVILEAADRDGDGKLTRPEFDAYFDLQDSFRNVGLSLTPAVQTPTLFQLLDENRDGRLSVRELRTAWGRLGALEEPGADALTKAIIQPAVTVRMARNFDRFLPGAQPVANFGNPNQVVVPTKGPLWFRKMDRNGDGDLSRSEFLGTGAEFDALDTDRDGLISLPEAEAYDKATRQKGDK